MILKIKGLEIKKPVASVYEMEDGSIILRIDDEDALEFWVEVTLDSRHLQDEIFTKETQHERSLYGPASDHDI